MDVQHFQNFRVEFSLCLLCKTVENVYSREVSSLKSITNRKSLALLLTEENVNRAAQNGFFISLKEQNTSTNYSEEKLV